MPRVSAPSVMHGGAKTAKPQTRFRVLVAEDIFLHLQERQEISSWKEVSTTLNLTGPFSDEAMLVTPDGLLLAAKNLDSATRLARRILVYPSKGAAFTSAARDLLAASPYAAGLSVEGLVATTSHGEAAVPQ